MQLILRMRAAGNLRIAVRARTSVDPSTRVWLLVIPYFQEEIVLNSEVHLTICAR